MRTSFDIISKLYPVFQLLFQLIACSNAGYFMKSQSLRIYGGQPAQLGEIPYQIAFKRPEKDEMDTYCGGAILGESKILSAAHCFVEQNTEFFTALCYGDTYLVDFKDKYAVAGTIRTLSREEEAHEQWRAIKTIKYPPTYLFPKDDIALVFVVEPYIFNDLVQPIQIAKKFEDYKGSCLASGYGAIGKDIYSDVLLKALVPLMSRKRCHKKAPHINWYRAICTVYSKRRIGPGDSGGPLVCTKGDEKIVVGISCATNDAVNTIFTRVSAYHKYIDRNRCEKCSSIRYFVISVLILLHNYIDIFIKF